MKVDSRTYDHTRIQASAIKMKQPEAKKDDHEELVTEEIISKKVEAVNKEFKQLNKDLKVSYTIHKETNRVIVQVYDAKEDQLVFEFPSSKILDFTASQDSFIIDEKV